MLRLSDLYKVATAYKYLISSNSTCSTPNRSFKHLYKSGHKKNYVLFMGNFSSHSTHGRIVGK